MTTSLPALHVRVEWAGSQAGFSEVSGLTHDTSAVDSREEATRGTSTGFKTSGTLTLKRGIVGATDPFFSWLSTATGGHRVDGRDLTLVLLDERSHVVARWRVTSAFPLKVVGPDVKVSGKEVAIESMELAHEGLVLIE